MEASRDKLEDLTGPLSLNYLSVTKNHDKRLRGITVPSDKPLGSRDIDTVLDRAWVLYPSFSKEDERKHRRPISRVSDPQLVAPLLY